MQRKRRKKKTKSVKRSDKRLDLLQAQVDLLNEGWANLDFDRLRNDVIDIECACRRARNDLHEIITYKLSPTTPTLADFRRVEVDIFNIRSNVNRLINGRKEAEEAAPIVVKEVFDPRTPKAGWLRRVLGRFCPDEPWND